LSILSGFLQGLHLTTYIHGFFPVRTACTGACMKHTLCADCQESME